MHPLARFSYLPREKWIHLGLLVLVLFYVIFISWSVGFRGLFDYVGVDYRGFLASAQIVRDHGFAAVYDLGLQKEYQQSLYRYSLLASKLPMDVNPTPYLPPFIAPFLLFLPFDAPMSFGVFVLVNAVVFAIYLRRLFKQAGLGKVLSVSGFILCLPAVFNLFFGQVNVWLLIFVGESLIAFRQSKEVRSGIWLAGLLVKPQMLILLIPGLIVGKKWRAVLGFVSASAVILLSSLLLAGGDGLMMLVRLLRGYADTQGLPTNFPESMMNWRAFAVNFDSIAPVKIGLTIALTGIIVTALAGLALWLFRAEASSSAAARIWLGTLAATLVVAWHSHVHTALLMLAPLAFSLTEARVPRVIAGWLFAPAAIFLGIFWVYTPIVVVFGINTPFAGPTFAHLATGFSLFALNLAIVVWVFHSLIQDGLPRLLRGSCPADPPKVPFDLSVL